MTFIGIYLMQVVPLFANYGYGQWDLLWAGLAALPEHPDFWLWFYLAFAISSTMLPSVSDRRAWLPISIPLVVLILLGLIAGAGPWMLDHLAPGLVALMQSLVMIFGISLAVHLVLGLPVGLAAALVSKLTGLRVVN